MAHNQQKPFTFSNVLALSRFRSVSLAQVDNTHLLRGHRRALCAGCQTVVNPRDPLNRPGHIGERCRHCQIPLWCSHHCAQFHGHSIRLDSSGPPEILIPSSREMHEKICLRGVIRHPFGERTLTCHHQAFLFPTGEDTGRLIWVYYDQKTATLTVEDPSFHTFGIQAYCEPTRRVLLRDDPEMKGWTFEFDLLLISYPQLSMLVPHQMTNQSIAALAKPLQLKTWSGPMVVVAVSRNRNGEHCLVHSVNPRDVSAAVIYHLRHLDNLCRPLVSSWEDSVYPVLKMTDSENKYISSAYGPQPAWAPVLVGSWRDRIWKLCMAAHRLGLRWYISSGNCRSWQNLDRGANRNARWLKYVPDDD